MHEKKKEAVSKSKQIERHPGLEPGSIAAQVTGGMWIPHQVRDDRCPYFSVLIHPLFLFQAGSLPMRLAHQSPASSTILSTAAFRPSGFLPPAVAKWG